MLDVVITHPASTRPRMRTLQVIWSSAVSSQARTGFGTTEQTNTWTGPNSHRRCIIPSINPCPDQPAGSPRTGKTCCVDEATGADLVATEPPATRAYPPPRGGDVRASPLELQRSCGLGDWTRCNRKESGDDMVDGTPAWSVRSVLVSVTDLDNSMAFYLDVMNLQEVLRQDRMAALSSDAAGHFTLYLRHANNASHPGQQAVGVRSLVYDVGNPAELDRVEERLRASNSLRSRQPMGVTQPFELVHGHDPDRLPLTFMAFEERSEMSLDVYCRVMTAMYSVDL
jgi:hypothetical protein